MLKVGQKAPSTKIFDSTGKEVSLMDLKGKYVVLYFYPKDDTPGCTTEACGLRDANREIQKLGAVVIGVSKDSGKSHKKFMEKYHLNFTLWSDPEHKLMDAFGTWQKKNFMGRTYMGTTRSTFVVDPAGKIIKVWEKVTPEGHAEEVLAFLKTQ